MAVENLCGIDLPCVAHSSGSLATYQYHVVRTTGAATNGLCYVGLCISSTGNAASGLGILQNTPAASQAAQVRVFGVSKAATVSAITAPALLTVSTGGCVEAIAGTSGEYVIGRALTSSATTSGELIDILWQPVGDAAAGGA